MMEVHPMRVLKILCLLMAFLGFAHVPYSAGQTGEIPVDPQILPIVVKISTFSEREKKPITGTGFIVSREVKSASETKRVSFLVTNKHMVSDWTLADGDIKDFNKYLQVYFYRTDFSPEHPTQSLRIDLCDKQGRVDDQKVQTHSNPFVDVAVVFLQPDLMKATGINVPSFDVSFLLPFDRITSNYFNIGSQVFVIGYPLGITSLRNNYPLAKFGYIAATPGEEFAIEMLASDRKNIPKKVKLVGKLLVMDGLIVPGNSGGPVVLPSVIKTRINPKSKSWEYTKEPSKNLVIGILAGGFGLSGLSYTYSSDYIIETINDYLKKNGLQATSNWP
jgi:S1-C subfamily serine protease